MPNSHGAKRAASYTCSTRRTMTMSTSWAASSASTRGPPRRAHQPSTTPNIDVMRAPKNSDSPTDPRVSSTSLMSTASK